MAWLALGLSGSNRISLTTLEKCKPRREAALDLCLPTLAKKNPWTLRQKQHDGPYLNGPPWDRRLRNASGRVLINGMQFCTSLNQKPDRTAANNPLKKQAVPILDK